MSNLRSALFTLTLLTFANGLHCEPVNPPQAPTSGKEEVAYVDNNNNNWNGNQNWQVRSDRNDNNTQVGSDRNVNNTQLAYDETYNNKYYNNYSSYGEGNSYVDDYLHNRNPSRNWDYRQGWHYNNADRDAFLRGTDQSDYLENQYEKQRRYNSRRRNMTNTDNINRVNSNTNYTAPQANNQYYNRGY